MIKKCTWKHQPLSELSQLRPWPVDALHSQQYNALRVRRDWDKCYIIAVRLHLKPCQIYECWTCFLAEGRTNRNEHDWVGPENWLQFIYHMWWAAWAPKVPSCPSRATGLQPWQWFPPTKHRGTTMWINVNQLIVVCNVSWHDLNKVVVCHAVSSSDKSKRVGAAWRWHFLMRSEIDWYHMIFYDIMISKSIGHLDASEPCRFHMPMLLSNQPRGSSRLWNLVG